MHCNPLRTAHQSGTTSTPQLTHTAHQSGTTSTPQSAHPPIQAAQRSRVIREHHSISADISQGESSDSEADTPAAIIPVVLPAAFSLSATTISAPSTPSTEDLIRLLTGMASALQEQSTRHSRLEDERQQEKQKAIELRQRDLQEARAQREAAHLHETKLREDIQLTSLTNVRSFKNQAVHQSESVEDSEESDVVVSG
jgi:hypothetical protein